MELMGISQISPDQVVFWSWGFVKINATLVYTWLVMGILVLGSWGVTRKLSTGRQLSRWQNFLEMVVSAIRAEIQEVSRDDAASCLPLVGTLFLFIGLSNLLVIVPGYVAPTASLMTTAALAVCVFFAVPIFGIARLGWLNYLKGYVQPTLFFFPFHVMGEISRTLALTVRLFGNIMSHEKVVAILLALTPLFFPVLMQILGILIGLIQAYIFAILAMVYIASATQAHDKTEDRPPATGAG